MLLTKKYLSEQMDTMSTELKEALSTLVEDIDGKIASMQADIVALQNSVAILTKKENDAHRKNEMLRNQVKQLLRKLQGRHAAA